MNQYIVYVVAAILLASCNPPSKDIEVNSSIVDTLQVIREDDKFGISKNQEFLDKFRLVVFDTMRFISPTWDEGKIGPNISANEMKLFPATFTEDPYWGDQGEYQAFLKFEINDKHYGLVARMPGEYAFTSLQLFLYDRIADQIIPPHYELADVTGDAGYKEEKHTWLYKESNAAVAYTYHLEQLDKIEPSDPVIPYKKENYYLVQISPDRLDTLQTDGSKVAEFETYWRRKTQ